MRIGFDIDDTTLVTVKPMIKYADIYSVEDLKREGTKGNIGLIKDRFYLNALYGWTEEEKFSFFNKYYKNVLEECEPHKNAPEIIRKLKTEKNEIYFISSRITSIKDCPAEDITKETFEKYNIPYDKLIIGAYDKLDYCLENKIDIFIDDSLEVCQLLSQYGITCFLMTSPMNANIVTKSIKRVHSWTEIYDNIREVLNDSRILKK